MAGFTRALLPHGHAAFILLRQGCAGGSPVVPIPPNTPMLTTYQIISLVLAALASLLALAIWSLTRKREGRWSKLAAQDSESASFPPMAAHLTLGSLSDGNGVRPLQNGDGFWPEILSNIRRAQHTVHFETFLWKTGALSAQLVEAFCERAGVGIEVRVLVDAEGGKRMDKHERERMAECGVKLSFYRPRKLEHLGTYNGRDHRKLLVVDSRDAYLGGHCVDDCWLGSAQDRNHYRDVSLHVRGPIVNQVQAGFAENWTEVTGQLLAGEGYFPEQPRSGGARAHLAFINTAQRVSSVKTLYVLAIASAKRTLLIQNPYFLPDTGARDALAAATKRGVRVRVMTPTFGATDAKLVLHAMRYRLRPLLEAGVEVLGYPQTLLHQKLLVVDGHWSIVGSTNFDYRSFEINDEVSVSVFDRQLAQQLEQTFENDSRSCKRYTVNDLEERSFWDRTRDLAAWHMRQQL